MSTALSTPLRLGRAYAVVLVAMLLLDAAWLGVVARDFYREEMGSLMADPVRLGPAALFYLLYPLGVVGLGLRPKPPSLRAAALRCAFVGLFAYGTYDITGLAVLNGFGVRLAVVDMAWGTFATAVAGGLAYRIASAVRKGGG